MNITDPIRRHAELSPSSVAIIRADGNSISYAQLDRTLDFQARRALDLGLVPGDTAGMRLSDGYARLIVALALARAGIAAAPGIMPARTMKLCFSEDGVAPNGSANVVTADRTWWNVPGEEVSVPRMTPDQDGSAVCHVFTSSGTTGVPKFVAVSHDMMARRIASKSAAVRAPDASRQICFIGMATSYGFTNSLRTLWVGGQLIMPTAIDQVLPFVRRFGVNGLLMAPITLEHLVAPLPSASTPLPTLEIVEVGGSALPSRLYELARARLCPHIVSLYGAVETASIAAAPVHQLAAYPGAVGYIHEGVEVQAVSDDDEPLPAGTEGILRVRSNTCASSYVGDTEASARVFRQGWVYPGDVGTVSPGGLLTVAGRTSDVINNGGNKVSPKVIEDILCTLEQVKEAAAFGAPDALGVTQIWAAIIPNGAMNADNLRAICRARLRDNAPTHFLEVAELPRNAAGKILREELRKMVMQQTAAAASGPVPL